MKTFKRLLSFVISAAMLGNIFIGLNTTVFAAAVDEPVWFTEFKASEGYQTGNILNGQPASASNKWRLRNDEPSTGNSSKIIDPASVGITGAPGYVAQIYSLAASIGQETYQIQSQSKADLSYKGRAFFPAQSTSFQAMAHTTAGGGSEANGTQVATLQFNAGQLRYIGTGDGSNSATNFTNGSYTIPSGGAWVNFELRFIWDENNNVYGACEYYFGIEGGAPAVGTKLTPGNTPSTVRNKAGTIDRMSLQGSNAANAQGYLSSIDVKRLNVRYPLPAPQVSWKNNTGNIITWNAAPGARTYTIKIYKNAKLVGTAENISDTSYDLTNDIIQYSYGTYTATAKAIADPAQDKDSIDSEFVTSRFIGNQNPQLSTPEKPIWNGNIITWQTVTGTAVYAVDLYKASVRVNTFMTANAAVASYNLEGEMLAKGAGAYKVRIRALANQSANQDSEPSEFSEYNNFDPSVSNIEPTDRNLCITAANAVTEKTLTSDGNDNVINSLTLPLTGLNGTRISWSSDNSAISGSGIVARPDYGSDVIVTLTAVFSKGNARYEKMYKFIVKSMDSSSSDTISSSNITYTNNPQNTLNGVFSDVPYGHWAKNDIEYLYFRGIIKGSVSNTFEPERFITREEVCQLLSNLLGLSNDTASMNFSDVPSDAWFYSAVSMANAADIVKGVNDTEFGAGENISRQDLAVMIDRAIKYANITLDGQISGVDFADAAQIASYAKDSVKLLTVAGILSGYEDGRFSPLGTATRAEVTKVITILDIIKLSGQGDDL